ncbi:hypothetical protein MLD38_022937 [Melastoma candidum]|uniref:Uncharacterized protein n=1 Tax=Melastoma candidum TaxID=119954 RepID=A0ACB9QKT8_9MYRT|nr:hypothetical protein MLD38_022937 [Melastoma candidum]
MASKPPEPAIPNAASPSSSTTTSSSSNKRLRGPNQPAVSFLPTTPPPPSNMSRHNVSLRLLCHVSRVGGVIGKSGSSIKLLQSSTSSTIRILDPGPSSASAPDRVIHISAPAAVSGSISLGGGEESDVVAVSRAQEALIRVFERVLEVAEGEVGGEGIGSGMVSCRLLAEKSKAGSVIGKGGKVIERIRKETGCRIRVLSEKLPPCASSDDEVIEIEGIVLGVKKALVAISGCLQECESADKSSTRSAGNRAGPISVYALPNSYADVRQRNAALSAMPSSSTSYSSGVYASSDEFNGVLETKPLRVEVTFRILCSNDTIGGVIGKGGSIVRALQNESGASISVAPALADCSERLITITASENPEMRQSPAQKAVILVFSRSIDVGTEKGRNFSKGSPVVARLVVPPNHVNCLLGQGGSKIAEMRRLTGANIWVLVGNQVPKCALQNDHVVEISGEFPNVQEALYTITSRLRDNLIPGPSNVIDSRIVSSLSAETSLYGRLNDPVPIGFNPSTVLPPFLSRHAAPPLDNDGLLCHPSHSQSKRPWESSCFSGQSQRSMMDSGHGLPSIGSGLELGRCGPEQQESWQINSQKIGQKSAIVTNTTVEIMVPEDVIHCVLGQNGKNLAKLRQISGAKVLVHEAFPGKTERTVIISGTPDETQAAQSLLHAFILTGFSFWWTS